MNAHTSSMKRNDLEALDAQLLPWPLETLEEQGLLALGMQVLFTKKGCTLETKRNVQLASQRPQSGEFAVWVENDEASDDGDDIKERREEVEEDEDSSSPHSSCSDQSSDDSTPSKKRNIDAADFTDAVSDEEEEFDAEAYITGCQVKPLPKNAVFRWVNVRKVTVTPQWDDKQKATGNYSFICDCGFPKRIGVCCRHVLAVLFMIVLENERNAEKSDSTENDDQSVYGDPSSINWSLYPGILQGLCSMNLCSKIKYHAALHQKGHLFKREVQPFKPTVPKYVPESFLQNFAPDKDQLQRIPRNGLPLDSDDIEVRTQVKNL
jgi:hypothetical protein